MSKLILDTDKKKYKNYILDVMFLYVKLQKPVPSYAKEGEQSTSKEYCVDIVVDEDTADSFDDALDKSAISRCKTAIFKEKYKVDPPYPDDKYQYLIKLRAFSHYEDGTEVPYSYKTRPKVLVPVEEGKVKDITMDMLVGNGSKGDVSFSIKDSKYGTSAKVTNILVKDLIVYEVDDTETAFGSVINADEAVEKATKASYNTAPIESKEAPTPPQEEVVEKKGKRQYEEDTVDEDDDIPF